jgi:hypothetical protein
VGRGGAKLRVGTLARHLRRSHDRCFALHSLEGTLGRYRDLACRGSYLHLGIPCRTRAASFAESTAGLGATASAGPLVGSYAGSFAALWTVTAPGSLTGLLKVFLEDLTLIGSQSTGSTAAGNFTLGSFLNATRFLEAPLNR